MPHRSKIPQTLRSKSCMPYSAGDHMRATGKAAEARVATLMNRWANVQVYPALLSEYNKKPFGCTMSLHFYQTHLRPNTHLDSPERLRQQSRCKAAVICTAIQCHQAVFTDDSTRIRVDPQSRDRGPPYGCGKPSGIAERCQMRAQCCLPTAGALPNVSCLFG
ncbi:hypothetical protein BDR03DRAFT_447669 [Suillus americanus]|nr:hypothetical protein BDR03DRAFT_447669 [Suillus americanus]